MREGGREDREKREGGSEGGRTERSGRLSNVLTENVHTHTYEFCIQVYTHCVLKC